MYNEVAPVSSLADSIENLEEAWWNFGEALQVWQRVIALEADASVTQPQDPTESVAAADSSDWYRLPWKARKASIEETMAPRMRQRGRKGAWPGKNEIRAFNLYLYLALPIDYVSNNSSPVLSLAMRTHFLTSRSTSSSSSSSISLT
jgi:hypothetical protein